MVKSLSRGLIYTAVSVCEYDSSRSAEFIRLQVAMLGCKGVVLLLEEFFIEENLVEVLSCWLKVAGGNRFPREACQDNYYMH